MNTPTTKDEGSEGRIETFGSSSASHHARFWMPVAIVAIACALVVAGIAYLEMTKAAETSRALKTADQSLSTTQSELTSAQGQLSSTEGQLSDAKAELSSAKSELSTTQSQLGGTQSFADACKSAFEASREAMGDVVKATQSNNTGDVASGTYWLQQGLDAIQRAEPDVKVCNSGLSSVS